MQEKKHNGGTCRLNTAAMDAFASEIFHAAEADPGSDPVDVLLDAIGRQFPCSRVFICERRRNGSFDNTYEWCAPGVISAKDMFQNSPAETYAYWYSKFADTHECYLQKVDELKQIDSDLYYLLSRQDIHTVLSDQIRYNGTDYGIIGVDNPEEEAVEALQELLRLIRPYVASLLYSRDLKRTLLNSGYMDRLTGAGNRLSLNDVLERISHDGPLGLLAVDLISLKKYNTLHGHDAGDALLIQVTELLNQIFGPNFVFRIDGDEFLAIYLEASDANLYQKLHHLQQAFLDTRIEAVCACMYENPWTTDFDTLLRRMDLSLFEQKRSYMRNRREAADSTSRQYRKSLLCADLNSDQISALYRGSIGELPSEILSEVTESRLAKVHPEDKAVYRSFWDQKQIRSRFHQQPGSSHSIVYRIPKDQEWIWVEETMELLENSEDAFRILVTVRTDSAMRPFLPIHDSVIKKTEHAKASLSMYRNTEFFHRASYWLSQTDERRVMMIAIDINHFKLYNSMFGLNAGNRVLEMLQSTLLAISHECHGIAGYMGNDNFALLLPLKNESVENALQRMEREIRNFRVPALFMPYAGVYVCDDFTELPSEMYEFANLASDLISGDLNSHVTLFSKDQYLSRKEEQYLLLDIEEGLAKDEFIFYLQPKVNMRTGNLISFEALGRWNHGGKIIAPARFVEAMEKANIVYKLDILILEKVCAWLKERIDQGLPVIPVSVNLSRSDFVYGDIAETVDRIVNTYQIPHKLVQIEVTESAFNEDDGKIQHNIDEMQKRGHKILLDDFGKGYSSLNSLHSMNLDVLKLDKQFIDALNQEDDRRIVETVIRMAHMIGLLVIAEGVETRQQADLLVSLNCHYCQGYYYYKPLPKEEAAKLINDPAVIQETPPYISSMRFGSLSFAELIDEKLLTAEQVNSLIGPIAIFEVNDENIHILQMNDQYAEILEENPGQIFGAYNFLDRLEEAESAIRKNFEIADAHPGHKSSASYRKKNGARTNLEATIYPISKTEQARFYLVSLRENES